MSLEVFGDGGDQDDSYTQKRVDEIVAEAVAEALAERWRPIEAAVRDGRMYLGYRFDPDRRSDPHAYCIVRYGTWLSGLPAVLRLGWLSAQDGEPVWPEPTHCAELEPPGA